MKQTFAGMGLVLALLLQQPAAAGTVHAVSRMLHVASPVSKRIGQAQYLNLPPRIRPLAQALPLRSRRPGLRPPPPPPRAFAPPLPRRTRQALRDRPGRKPAVKVRPSEALRLAQRRWPDSIGLSVRLLRQEPPMYVVKLRTHNRVVRVLVDARTGRVLQ